MTITREPGLLSDPIVQSGSVQLTSPYREISGEILAKLAGVEEELTGFVTELSAEQAPTTFDQRTVDEVAANIFGPENLPQALQMGSLFQELIVTLVRDRKGVETTALRDGLDTLVYCAADRRSTRRIFGSDTVKAGRLADYCKGIDMLATKEQIATFGDKVVQPILQTRDATLKAKLTDASLSELTDLLKRACGFDAGIDLGVLKLACFLTIADSLRQPQLYKAWDQSWAKDAQTTNNVKKIKASEFGMLYEASKILEDLRTQQGSARYRTLHSISRHHARTRVVPVPSRAFKREYAQLSAATIAYVNLVRAEKWLHDIKDRTKEIEALRGKLVGWHATQLAILTSDHVAIGKKHLAEARDSSVEASAGDGEAVESAWQSAIAAEELVVAAAKGLHEQFKSAQLRVSPDAKTRLVDAMQPSFRDELDQRQRAEAIRQLQPEIDRCTAEFKAIDAFYTLSNKKLRERDPNLITLAHTLFERFSGQSSPDEAALRAMVGLMLGVYWERTGQQSDPTEMATQYLSDISQLRIVKSQLEKLGQNIDSTLLQSINLLDELIDSGAFDDIEGHPELEPLVHFALYYLNVRDGANEAKTNPDTGDEELPETEEVESAQSTLSELPIEIIGQATPEDILVFPPGSSYQEIVEEYTRHLESEDETVVQWDRIKKLVELRDHCTKQNLAVNLIRTKQASWHRLPFFVLEVKLPGSEHGVAVLESPVYGNATYTFREDDDRLPWRDVVELTRQEAREWGAVPAVHVDDTQLDKHMKKLWDRIISDLTAF